MAIGGISTGAQTADLFTARDRIQRSDLQTPAESQIDVTAPGERVSPFEIAQQIQEVQVANLERALDAQTLVLDLLA